MKIKHEDWDREWLRVKMLATNVIGFHDLTERRDIELTSLKRMEYDAQVYASGVALAETVMKLLHGRT